MSETDPPENPKSKFIQSTLVYGAAVVLCLLGLRLIVRASDLPDWALTLIVLVVFLSLPIAAVVLWFIAHRRS
jgi:predicted tellurium resistance membrane protein TerC